METTELTVVEFAAKHADACPCGTERVQHIRTHVDLLIEAAVAHNKVLWNVGVDAEGRVSLIWLSYSVDAWQALLEQAVQMQALKALLGLDR